MSDPVISVEVEDVLAPPGAKWASIKLGDETIFTELVMDNEPEKRIVNRFARALRDLLEGV